MILSLSISTPRLLNECISQTSFDFQALRARNGESANAVHDDWVMNIDNRDDIYFPLQEAGADMYNVLHTLLHSFSAGKDIIRIDICAAREGLSDAVEGLMRQFFKYRLLTWWYAYRDADLAANYAQRAASALNNIFDYCVPRTGTKQPRYF